MRIKGIDLKKFIRAIDGLFRAFHFQQPQFHFATNDKAKSLVIVQIATSHDVLFGKQHVDAFATDAEAMNFTTIIDKYGRYRRVGNPSGTFTDMRTLQYFVTSHFDLFCTQKRKLEGCFV